MATACDRQLAKAEAYCLKHRLTLDTELSFEDLGKSAFRGDNLHVGRLGAFMKAIEDELVIQGDRLLIENLDRLSRQAVRKVIAIINKIVDAGIILVTLDDQKEYSAEILDKDPMAIMMVMLTSVRANEESMRKGERLRASWSARRATALEKPLTSPRAWLVEAPPTDARVRHPQGPRPRRQTHLQGCCSWQRPQQHCRDLEPRRRAHLQRWANFGIDSTLAPCLDNPAVVGTWQPHVVDYKQNGNGRQTKVRRPLEPIVGYFPAIIDEALFNKVKAMRETKIPAMRGSGELNMLAGLLRCVVCGGSMNRVSKGRRTGRGQNRFVCAKARAGAGCAYKSVQQQKSWNRPSSAACQLHPASDPQTCRCSSSSMVAALKKAETAIANLVEQASMGPSIAIISAARSFAGTQERAAEEPGGAGVPQLAHHARRPSTRRWPNSPRWRANGRSTVLRPTRSCGSASARWWSMSRARRCISTGAVWMRSRKSILIDTQ